MSLDWISWLAFSAAAAGLATHIISQSTTWWSRSKTEKKNRTQHTLRARERWKYNTESCWEWDWRIEVRQTKIQDNSAWQVDGRREIDTFTKYEFTRCPLLSLSCISCSAVLSVNLMSRIFQPYNFLLSIIFLSCAFNLHVCISWELLLFVIRQLMSVHWPRTSSRPLILLLIDFLWNCLNLVILLLSMNVKKCFLFSCRVSV